MQVRPDEHQRRKRSPQEQPPLPGPPAVLFEDRERQQEESPRENLRPRPQPRGAAHRRGEHHRRPRRRRSEPASAGVKGREDPGPGEGVQGADRREPADPPQPGDARLVQPRQIGPRQAERGVGEFLDARHAVLPEDAIPRRQMGEDAVVERAGEEKRRDGREDGGRRRDVDPGPES